MNPLKANSEAVKSLCEKHKVEKLYAFGSVLTSAFSEESDIDLVVEFEQGSIVDFATNYFELKFALEDLFGRSVDLIEYSAIRNPYFKEEVDECKVLVFNRNKLIFQ